MFWLERRLKDWIEYVEEEGKELEDFWGSYDCCCEDFSLCADEEEIAGEYGDNWLAEGKKLNTEYLKALEAVSCSSDQFIWQEHFEFGSGFFGLAANGQ